MSYVIATDSRKRDEALFMVDRSRQRASFWSNRLDDALVYTDKGAADRKAQSLRFNRPRVMTLDAARRLAADAEVERINHVGMAAMEAGWDGHKNVF